MLEVLAGFLVFSLAILLMAVGVLAGRPAIRGSCGGLANIAGAETECIAGCTRPCPRKEARASKGPEAP